METCPLFSKMGVSHLLASGGAYYTISEVGFIWVSQTRQREKVHPFATDDALNMVKMSPNSEVNVLKISQKGS